MRGEAKNCLSYFISLISGFIFYSVYIYAVPEREVIQSVILNEVKNPDASPQNSGLSMTIKQGNLSSGMYFYQLKNNKEILATGKVAIE